MNTDISTRVMPMIGANRSCIALLGGRPWPFRPVVDVMGHAPSTTTMASSTTMPMASTMANRVDRLMVKPRAAMAAKAPMMVTGTVVAGTRVARTVLQEHQDDDQHKHGRLPAESW